MAVVASTLTNVVVFLPLVFVTGLANIIMRDLAYTLSFSMMMSLAMALALVPVLCARFQRLPRGAAIRPPTLHGEKVDLEISLADVELHTGSRVVDAVAGASSASSAGSTRRYERVLAWALRRSGWVLAVAVVLLGASVASIVLLGMEFLPETDEGRLTISLETRVESSLARTSATRARRRADRARRAGRATSPPCPPWSARSGGTRLGTHRQPPPRRSASNLVAEGPPGRDIWTIADALSRRDRSGGPRRARPASRSRASRRS